MNLQTNESEIWQLIAVPLRAGAERAQDHEVSDRDHENVLTLLAGPRVWNEQ